jgi:hypothetical protein
VRRPPQSANDSKIVTIPARHLLAQSANDSGIVTIPARHLLAQSANDSGIVSSSKIRTQ